MDRPCATVVQNANTRIFRMPFASVYPPCIAQAEKKGHTKERCTVQAGLKPRRYRRTENKARATLSLRVAAGLRPRQARDASRNQRARGPDPTRSDPIRPDPT